jgi:tetratricopeptide (TPR) repeat protein
LPACGRRKFRLVDEAMRRLHLPTCLSFCCLLLASNPLSAGPETWSKEARRLIAACTFETSTLGVMSFVAADEDKAWRAVGLFSRALNTQPGDATLWAERAMAYYFLRQMELARRDCLEATAITPAVGKAWINQAYIVDRMINEDFDAAERSMLRAKAANPDLSEFHSFAADLYLHWGRPEKAIPEAEAGRRADPAASVHLINLAHALLFTGQTDAARTLYLQAMQLPAEQGLTGADFILHDYQMYLARGRKKYPEIAPFTDWVKRQRQAPGP